MGQAYLSSDELAGYGVAGATDQQIDAASRLVDSIIDRPEGLVWVVGADGRPAYMSGSDPRITVQTDQAFASGENVTVPVAMADMVRIGEVLIADRTDADAAEPLVVIGKPGVGLLTFQNVVYAHSEGCTFDAGMVLETTARPSGAGFIQLPLQPCVRIFSVATVGLGGLGMSMPHGFVAPDRVQVLEPFSAQLFEDHRLIACRAATVSYLAGYALASLPTNVKTATANILSALIDHPELGGNMKVVQAGGTRFERWADTLVDTDTRRLLNQFLSVDSSFR